jgi:signal transduction histidine kinase
MERPAEAARAAAAAERRRLARELHDSVSQTLIGLHLTAQAAVELWETQPAQARAALETVRSLAAGASTELRAVLLDLHDAVLERRGLVAALEAYCAVVRERNGLHVELQVVEPGQATRDWALGPGRRLPARHEEAVYRLVQEALANVVKHARASRATVTLALDAPLRVWTEDDGVGFGAPEPAFSYGLVGMRERVDAAGAGCAWTTGQAARGRTYLRTPQREGRADRCCASHAPVRIDPLRVMHKGGGAARATVSAAAARPSTDRVAPGRGVA